MNYWLSVTCRKDFVISRDKLKPPFSVLGGPTRQRKTVEKEMEVGDKLVYYIKKSQKFGAITKVTGTYYEEFTKVWTTRKEELWPERRGSEPEIVLREEEFVDIKNFIDELRFIKNKKNWGASLRGTFREIKDKNDFKLIEAEMKKSRGRAS